MSLELDFGVGSTPLVTLTYLHVIFSPGKTLSSSSSSESDQGTYEVLDGLIYLATLLSFMAQALIGSHFCSENFYLVANWIWHKLNYLIFHELVNSSSLYGSENKNLSTIRASNNMQKLEFLIFFFIQIDLPFWRHSDFVHNLMS